MQQLLKIIYICIIGLFIAGSFFVYFTSQKRIEYFYELTLIAALFSLWGFFKKSKLIYFILLPGLIRIILHLKNEELTALLGSIHVLGTLIPFLVAYFLLKHTSDNYKRI